MCSFQTTGAAEHMRGGEQLSREALVTTVTTQSQAASSRQFEHASTAPAVPVFCRVTR